jgi:pullulanase/glycogen debranching enzyme
MHLLAAGGDETIYVFVNAHWEPRTFELPRLVPEKSWRRFVDTSLPSGEDALEPGEEAPLPPGRTYVAGPRSSVVLVGR